jgi:hypothetical protein
MVIALLEQGASAPVEVVDAIHPGHFNGSP